MSKNNQNDWRTQLAELGKEMKENMSEEERQALKAEEIAKKNRR